MESIKNNLPEWKEVADELALILGELLLTSPTPTSSPQSSTTSSSIFKLPCGYFMKMQETSAKEFTCYYGYDHHESSTEVTATPPGTTPPNNTTPPPPIGAAAIRIYARDGDIPLAQRRAHKDVIMAKAPIIPACVSTTPLKQLTLFHHRHRLVLRVEAEECHPHLPHRLRRVVSLLLPLPHHARRRRYHRQSRGTVEEHTTTIIISTTPS